MSNPTPTPSNIRLVGIKFRSFAPRWFDRQLLAVQVFDERAKIVAHNMHTQAVKAKNKSICPLTDYGGSERHNANKARIYDFDEMDANRIAARIRVGSVRPTMSDALQHSQPGHGKQVMRGTARCVEPNALPKEWAVL